MIETMNSLKNTLKRLWKTIVDKLVTPKGIGIVMIALILPAMAISIYSSQIAGREARITTAPTATVIEQITKNKHGLYISISHTFVVSKSDRKGATLDDASADEQLREFVKKGVVIDSYVTPVEAFPNQKVEDLNRLNSIILVFGIFLVTCLGISYVSKFNKQSAEKMEEIQKIQNQGPLAQAGKHEEVTINYEEPDTTFADVAGCDEAVESLKELSIFLKDPLRFARMGVKMPKGAILSGPPGTGKTLLARALAGESKVPFFTASGSEFTEIYVGAGAKNVRDLFSKVRDHDKAILFIDEIDAVGRSRSSNSYTGNSETEATLNQLLTEIDGFNSKHSDKAILIIAATNRSDLLDPALTRSGRLERKIEVPNPDKRGRKKILQLHCQGKPLSKDVDLDLIAARTPGFSGADMATIVNEAGLIAIREGKESIDHTCLDQAIADVAMGKARKSALVTQKDRLVTAWHEAGHTVCGYLQKDHDDPVAVSIIPRGPAGGITWFAGSEDIFLTRKKALSQLVTAFGGRVAEEMLMDGEFTQGASGDFQNATQIAYQMVTKYGMTDIGFQIRDDSVAASNEKVTSKVEELLKDAHEKAKLLLEANVEFLEALVSKLLDQDDVSYFEIEEMANSLGIKHERTMSSIPEVKTEPHAHKQLEENLSEENDTKVIEEV